MRIAMIGSGYVGLVSGVCFADFGHEVVCIDTDAAKVADLTAGRMPIYEPGIGELVARNAAAGRLTFSTDLRAGIAHADAVFLAVGTPSRRGDGHADLSYVFAAAEAVAAALAGPALVVIKSTVPVGTGDRVAQIVRDRRPELDVQVVSNPEFLREGAAIDDFKRPDRIVIGTDDPRARDVMRAIYRPLFVNEAPLVFTGRRTSELIKYAANAFLATKITFINEIADLCEAVGADVQDVARGIGMDRRIGRTFLHAGPGYGGSCFPKDTLALLQTAAEVDCPLQIVSSVVRANDERKRAMGQKIIHALGPDPAGKSVALLGLTFKPNTDDMRDAPSIVIAAALADAGITVHACDPEGMDNARKLMPDIRYHDDVYEAVDGVDATALVTEWDAYRALDLHRISAVMNGHLFVDLRNVYPAASVRAADMTHIGIGR